jgi:hypothetical protein
VIDEEQRKDHRRALTMLSIIDREVAEVRKNMRPSLANFGVFATLTVYTDAMDEEHKRRPYPGPAILLDNRCGRVRKTHGSI